MRDPRKKRNPRTPARIPRGRGVFVFVHALLAFALLLSQAARLSEQLVVEHAICEHGALLHVGGSAPAVADEGSKEKGEALFASNTPPFEHEHCDNAAIVHRPEALAPPFVTPTVLAVTLHEEPSPRLFARPIALLFEAPKASPPARAA
jgi:hypothetical protein